jgi:hypothetical protein
VGGIPRSDGSPRFAQRSGYSPEITRTTYRLDRVSPYRRIRVRFAVAFSKMPVLSFSRVAANRLHLPPLRCHCD